MLIPLCFFALALVPFVSIISFIVEKSRGKLCVERIFKIFSNLEDGAASGF